MKKNAEFSNLDARGKRVCERLEDHQIVDLVGVQKRRLFRRSNTRSKRSYAVGEASRREGFTLRYPPVVQNTQLNSDS